MIKQFTMNTSAKSNFIVAVVFALVLVIMLCSCGRSVVKDKEVPRVGDARILGVYTKRDGSKQVDILFRRIYEAIKYDSIKKEKIIVTDTLFAFPVTIKQVDSVGHILKDREGKDSINPNPVYVPIGKDSVRTDVSNIPVDSLLRK